MEYKSEGYVAALCVNEGQEGPAQGRLGYARPAGGAGGREGHRHQWQGAD